MQAVWWLVGFAMMFYVGHIQYKYAQANYPNTAKWRATLFLYGFLLGGIGALALELNSTDFTERILTILFLGLFLGFISAFLVPLNMRNIIPKKKE